MTGDTFTTLSFNVQRNLCFAVMVHGSPQCQWEEKKHLFTRWDKKNKCRFSTGQYTWLKLA